MGALPGDFTPVPEEMSGKMANRADFDKFDNFCDHMLVVDRETFDDDGQPASRIPLVDAGHIVGRIGNDLMKAVIHHRCSGETAMP